MKYFVFDEMFRVQRQAFFSSLPIAKMETKCYNKKTGRGKPWKHT